MKRGMAIVGVLLCAAGASMGQIGSTTLVTGLARPLYVTAPAGDYNRIFIIEQRGSGGTANRGAIRIFQNNALNPAAYLNVNGVTTGSEQGLLGLAFHPRYMDNPSQFGYFWVNYTGAGGTTFIARGRVSTTNPDLADTTFGTAGLQTLFTVAQPFENHNGGWVAFGPDGYLYLSLGDGGSAGDPNNAGQSLNTPLGKILRIDVDGPDNIPGNADDADPGNPTGRPFHRIPANNPLIGVAGAVEAIWAWGVRNPWRNSFDRRTGDLWLADVGQDQWEEVNIEPAFDRLNLQRSQAGYTGGRNYGWRRHEGNATFSGTTALTFPPVGTGLPQTAFFPQFVYGHTTSVPPVNNTGCSITGGFVYRGCRIPSLDGRYVFADYCTGAIWSYNRTTNTVTTLFNVGFGITSFGEDADGELYVTTQGGQVRRITITGAITDCNANGVPDACDIARGTSADCNANGIPDSCDIASGAPDCNTNGVPDSCDIANGSSPDINNNGVPDECECEVDLNGDLQVDFNDYLEFLNLYNSNNPRVDFNNDGIVDFNDYLEFLNLYNVGC